jgi:hypothetical protein
MLFEADLAVDHERIRGSAVTLRAGSSVAPESVHGIRARLAAAAHVQVGGNAGGRRVAPVADHQVAQGRILRPVFPT